jgi:hypothetical protein
MRAPAAWFLALILSTVLAARDPELKEMLRASIARHGSVKKVTELYLTGELDSFEAMVFERDQLGAGEQMRLALSLGRKGSFQTERAASLCAAFPKTPWPSYGTPYTCSAQPPSP